MKQLAEPGPLVLRDGVWCFTWDSVLACARLELVKAKDRGEKARVLALRKSIRIALRKVRRGEVFPVALELRGVVRAAGRLI